ncbi:MAG: hypothetical protein ACREAA_06055 [Candidatus Polarisedimenticolia bacterium]
MRRAGKPSRATVVALMLGTMLTAGSAPSSARQADAPKLTYYPSLQLKFRDAQARNYFVLQSGLVNASGGPLSDLVIRQRFPEGFTPSLLSTGAHEAMLRPEGFSESLEGGVYTMKLANLRVAEATLVLAELSYQGRPAAVPFPPLEVEYTLDGQRRSEKGPELTWDLSKYTKYSGTLREYIKRYAGLDMKIPFEDEDWGFSGLASRLGGKIATGPVEIESESSGRMRFSLQAGAPGTTRQLMLVRRPAGSARSFNAGDEVRRFVMDMVQSMADFTLDVDDFSVKKAKVGRFDAWVCETRWRDRVKDRLGEGPSRWYIFSDDKQSQYVVNISAQGRGVGPGRADTPNPDRERELMVELESMVASIRVL